VHLARADLAQLVEQLFRKEQVWGSSPQVGSSRRRVGWQDRAEVAESADALRSGRSGETRGSSNLPFGTVIRRLLGVARTLTSEWQGRKDGRGWWFAIARGKSELRRAEVPGESQGGG
jgi:hypothetical protein